VSISSNFLVLFAFVLFYFFISIVVCYSAVLCGVLTSIDVLQLIFIHTNADRSIERVGYGVKLPRALRRLGAAVAQKYKVH